MPGADFVDAGNFWKLRKNFPEEKDITETKPGKMGNLFLPVAFASPRDDPFACHPSNTAVNI